MDIDIAIYHNKVALMSPFHTVCCLVGGKQEPWWYGNTGIVQLTGVVFLTVPIEAHDVLKGRLKVTTIRSSHGPLTLSFHLQIQSPWEEKFHTARGYISATSAHWKCSSQENKRNALARPYKLAPAHKTQQSRKSAFIPLLVTMLGFSGQ